MFDMKHQQSNKNNKQVKTKVKISQMQQKVIIHNSDVQKDINNTHKE